MSLDDDQQIEITNPPGQWLLLAKIDQKHS